MSAELRTLKARFAQPDSPAVHNLLTVCDKLNLSTDEWEYLLVGVFTIRSAEHALQSFTRAYEKSPSKATSFITNMLPRRAVSSGGGSHEQAAA